MNPLILLSIDIVLYFGMLITNMIMKITDKVILTVICYQSIWLNVTILIACDSHPISHPPSPSLRSPTQSDSHPTSLLLRSARLPHEATPIPPPPCLEAHEKMFKKSFLKYLTLKMTLWAIFIIIFAIKYSSVSIDKKIGKSSPFRNSILIYLI